MVLSIISATILIQETYLERTHDYLYFRFESKFNDDKSYRQETGLYRNMFLGKVFDQDVTQLQAIHARQIFPCFDQPDMKGTRISVLL